MFASDGATRLHVSDAGVVLVPTDRRALALKAATHAYLYAGAVKHQAWQLLQPDSAENEVPADLADLRSAARQSHALMLMLALRNVLRAAEMAEKYADRPERQNLRAAVARFKNRLPDLVRARGVLEHFDEYSDVEGQTAALYKVRFLDGDGTYVIEAGGIHIDVRVALDEARRVAASVIAVAGEAWGCPVGNEVRSG